MKKVLEGYHKFLVDHNKSWAYPMAAKAMARLQADGGDLKGAINTLQDFEKNLDLTDDSKREAGLMLTDMQFQAGDLERVRARVTQALNDVKTPEVYKGRLQLYKIGCDAASASDAESLKPFVKQLEDYIGKTSDPSLRALAYNVMGDCYTAKGLKRDAMWSYLWVDVVYNQDSAEHIKAMTRLMKYFEGEGEKERDKVEMYREKLARRR